MAAAPIISSPGSSPPIRLLLADVDGTLVTQQKVLTDRAREAVMKLDAAGIIFAITSGRPPRGMSMLVEPLKLKTPVAGFNGGLFVNPDLSIIDAKTLPRDVAAAAVKTVGQVDASGGNSWRACCVHERRGDRVSDD